MPENFLQANFSCSTKQDCDSYAATTTGQYEYSKAVSTIRHVATWYQDIKINLVSGGIADRSCHMPSSFFVSWN